MEPKASALPLPLAPAFLGWLAGTVLLGLLLHLWFGWRDFAMFDRRLALLDERAADVEILALGSSRMAKGLDPAFLGPKAFNASERAQDDFYNAILLEQVLAKAKNLKAVVWELDAFTYAYDMYETPGITRRVKLYVPRFGRRTNEMNPRLWIESHVSFLRLRQHDPIWTLIGVVRGSLGRLAVLNANGFEQQNPFVEDLSGAAERARFHNTDCFHPDLINVNHARLVTGARTLEERGVALAFVHPPISSAYRAAISPERLDGFERFRSALLEKTRACYIDARDWYPDGEGFFQDGDHLQPLGAEAFSRRLADEIALQCPDAARAMRVKRSPTAWFLGSPRGPSG